MTSRFGHREADPAREQRDDELVERDALLGGEGDELFVECGGAPDQDSAVRVHAANNITRAIDITSSACDITSMTKTAYSIHPANNGGFFVAKGYSVVGPTSATEHRIGPIHETGAQALTAYKTLVADEQGEVA